MNSETSVELLNLPVEMKKTPFRHKLANFKMASSLTWNQVWNALQSAFHLGGECRIADDLLLVSDGKLFQFWQSHFVILITNRRHWLSLIIDFFSTLFVSLFAPVCWWLTEEAYPFRIPNLFGARPDSISTWTWKFELQNSENSAVRFVLIEEIEPKLDLEPDAEEDSRDELSKRLHKIQNLRQLKS